MKTAKSVSPPSPFDAGSKEMTLVSRHPMREQHLKTMEKTFHRLGHRHSLHQLFRDFIEMAAISISNAVDLGPREEREARYRQIVKQYNQEEVNEFPILLAELVNALEYGFDDILGRLFGMLELQNVRAGQFFTPYHICQFMGEMTVHDVKERLDHQEFITIMEPCIGAGGMVIAVAQAFRARDLNPQTQLHITGVDIDLTCVGMAYLQLSLLGLPAVLVHGNSLSREIWSTWYTPMHVLNNWSIKLRNHEQHAPDTSPLLLPAPTEAPEPAPREEDNAALAPVLEPSPPVQLTQLSLFGK